MARARQVVDVRRDDALSVSPEMITVGARMRIARQLRFVHSSRLATSMALSRKAFPAESLQRPRLPDIAGQRGFPGAKTEARRAVDHLAGPPAATMALNSAPVCRHLRGIVILGDTTRPRVDGGRQENEAERDQVS